MSQLPPSAVNVRQDKDCPTNASNSKFERRRRKIESITLAAISILGVWWIRFSIEVTVLSVAELLTVFVFAVCLAASQRYQIRIVSCAGMLVSPLLFAVTSRKLGMPISFEMTGLSIFGVASLALALVSKTSRQLALAVIASGFLVLFTTLISDDRGTLIPALTWIIFCLWHLVANHWERVSACSPENVRRSTLVRPLTVLVGLALFVLGGWIVHGRASNPRFLSWGVMPVSGGSTWSDPAARSGVGSGDAAIAAKDHAESFGAVESELFLESTQSSLFDMFSDSIGQPRFKPKWERRQGLANQNLIDSHQRTPKSERGGGSFSTARRKPPKHLHLKDQPEPAVLQWIGPTGIRLAMQRYDTFDGVDWTQSESFNDNQLSRVSIGDETWFFDTKQAHQRTKQIQHAGVIKVLRLDSPRIPSPMMTAGVHIKDVDREDFFGIDKDGSLLMPQRQRIPPLTVLHLASTSVMEDELQKEGVFASYRAPRERKSIRSEVSTANRFAQNLTKQHKETSGQDMASKLAQKLTAKQTNPYQKLQTIVAYLRSEYTFDRQFATDAPDPLRAFLINKRGGDHLFATAAALMGRSVGIRTRLATGFYVRPNTLDVGQGYSSVVAEDVHVWAEAQLDDGRWIEIEPTPGYREPAIKPSLWLLMKRFAQAYWFHLLLLAGLTTLVYVTRVVWFELFARLAWLFGLMLPDRQRIMVLLWILQNRGRLAGKPRRTGTPQRDWVLGLTDGNRELAAGALNCCNAADGIVFGGKVVKDWSSSASLLVRRLTTRYIASTTHSRISGDNSSQLGANP